MRKLKKGDTITLERGDGSCTLGDFIFDGDGFNHRNGIGMDVDDLAIHLVERAEDIEIAKLRGEKPGKFVNYICIGEQLLAEGLIETELTRDECIAEQLECEGEEAPANDWRPDGCIKQARRDTEFRARCKAQDAVATYGRINRPDAIYDATLTVRQAMNLIRTSAA